MEKTKTRDSSGFGPQGGRRFSNRNHNILLGFCLTLVTITCGACAAAPALILTATAVSAVAVATEGERLIQDVNEPNAVVVNKETDICTGPGGGYSSNQPVKTGQCLAKYP